MAIVKLPNDKPIPERLSCAICARLITPDEATAGMLDADNKQQFACNGHFWNPHQFIAGWADFLAAERAKRTRSQFVLEYGGEVDARTLR